MKRCLSSILVATMAFSYQSVLAQETFFGTLSGDVVYNGAVLLQGVTATADGVANIKLDGMGTLTVTSSVGGGFPRLMVIGGTTITSTRTFAAEETNKTTWSGQLGAPSSAVKPGFFDVVDPGVGFADDYEAVEAFGIGLANEEFGFSTPVEVVFPVSSQKGQKLWLANQNPDNTWTIDKNTFCIVDNNLCFLSFSKINKIALIKEKFQTCPVQNIANGKVGVAPNCIYSCNNGYDLNEAANGCVEVVGFEGFENQFNETTTETTTTTEQQIFENQITVPVKEYDFPPGHFRYRASGDKFYRYLNEDGLTATYDEDGGVEESSDLGTARLVNTSYLSRNPRTAEEQLMAVNSGKTVAQKAEDEGDFMSYLITMRNYFGKNSQENNFTTLSAGVEDNSEGASAEARAKGESQGGDFLSSGALLPSTGPGIFITIAIVGFALMMFGARRS